MEFSISEAAKRLDVENHVLRYWEEEMGLEIPRNALGHRVYREKEMKLFQFIRDLKEQGFQLKAIRLLIPEMDRVRQKTPQEIYELREKLNHQELSLRAEGAIKRGTGQKASSDKLQRFEEMMQTMVNGAVRQGLQEYMDVFFEKTVQGSLRSCMEEVSLRSGQVISETVATDLKKELNYLTMQRDELQTRQVEILQEILNQVKQSGNSSMAAEAATLESPAAGKKEKGGGKGKALRFFQGKK